MGDTGRRDLAFRRMKPFPLEEHMPLQKRASLVGRVITALSLTLFAISPATFAATAPIPATPDCQWAPIPSSDPSQCNYDPDNPQETNFFEVPTPEGQGIMFSTQSYTADHCGCTRRDQYFTLPCGAVNTTADNPHLRGWWDPVYDPADPFSVPSMIVVLSNGGPPGWLVPGGTGQSVGAATFVREIRLANNCNCQAFGSQRVLSPGSFDIALSSIVPNQSFDTVNVLLAGYGCGIASNSITVANLRLTYN